MVVDLSINRQRLGAGLLACALLLWATPVSGGTVRPQTPRVTCTACVVVDETGRVLWGRSAQRRLPNASTTKMMTALVAVAAADLHEYTTVSPSAGSVGGGGLDLQPGDAMQIRDLLVAMLLSSSNEAAATLAEYVAGSQEAFVRRMNALARRLGARNTAFVNPHGLDASGHYSSAADLARIGAAVIDHPALAEIVAAPRLSVDTPRGPVVEQNRNVLLESYDGAVGIKTGRTLGAGNVLVAAARRGQDTLIAVAMNSADAAADARQLLDMGFVIERRLDRPQPTVVLERGTTVGTLVFDPGGASAVVAAKSIVLDLPPDAPPVEYRWQPRRVRPPVAAGEGLGQVQVLSNGRVVATVGVVAADEVSETPAALVPNLLGSLINLVAGAVAVVT